ncbi:MAG: stage III sporulation protein AA [Clostridia bacterium]|nr:stage III sporulation protein AA [Clostridia bacterium]
MKTEHSLSYIQSLLPHSLHPYLTNTTEEIRFRRNREVMFLSSEEEMISPVISDRDFMEELLDRLTQSSIYTYSDNITEGYLTLEGGHRIGICGTGVYQKGVLSDVRDISSVNFRIAHEVKGCAEKVFHTVQAEKTLPGILIISPPGCGKTTLLRDVIRLFSNEIPKIKVAVVDERNELSGTYRGTSHNDLGRRTDILNGYQKSDGIRRAVRSLSPTLIGVDEIGSPEDEESLLYAHFAGVRVIATVHGNQDGMFQKNIARLTKEKVFDYYIYLSQKNPANRIESIQKVGEHPL